MTQDVHSIENAVIYESGNGESGESAGGNLQAAARDLLERVSDLNEMILSGQILEAHDKHYANDVVQQENELEPTVGKAANRRREEEFLSNVVDFRAAEVKAVAVDPINRTTFVEWFFDYDHREWGTRRYHQVSVQHWRDDKITYERFYYGA